MPRLRCDVSDGGERSRDVFTDVLPSFNLGSRLTDCQSNLLSLTDAPFSIGYKINFVRKKFTYEGPMRDPPNIR